MTANFVRFVFKNRLESPLILLLSKKRKNVEMSLKFTTANGFSSNKFSNRILGEVEGLTWLY